MTHPEPHGFSFLDPGPLVDGELSLRLEETQPWNVLKGWVPAYVFSMRVVGCAEPAGGIRLRIGDNHDLRFYVGHMGFEVDPARRGARLAARSILLLLPLARRHGLAELWLTCDPANLASRRTCELAGATLVDIVDLPHGCAMYERGERQNCRYRIDPQAG